MKQVALLITMIVGAFGNPALISSYAYTVHAPVVKPFEKSYTPMIYNNILPMADVKSQYHLQDTMGQISYGHVEPLQSHSAVQDASGNKMGSFSHVLPDGSIASTYYVADAMGYRVTASNALPLAPASAISDTPEVVEARIAHLMEVDKVKMRNKRAVSYITPYFTQSMHVPFTYSRPVVTHMDY